MVKDFQFFVFKINILLESCDNIQKGLVPVFENWIRLYKNALVQKILREFFQYLYIFLDEIVSFFSR